MPGDNTLVKTSLEGDLMTLTQVFGIYPSNILTLMENNT